MTRLLKRVSMNLWYRIRQADKTFDIVTKNTQPIPPKIFRAMTTRWRILLEIDNESLDNFLANLRK